jgi:hypothetical protein
MGSREASSHAKEEGEDVEAATALNCGMSLGEGICSVGENFDPLLVGRLTITVRFSHFFLTDQLFRGSASLGFSMKLSTGNAKQYASGSLVPVIEVFEGEDYYNAATFFLSTVLYTCF